MNRRNFVRTLISGIATTAAVRTFPFRVFSFPQNIRRVEFVTDLNGGMSGGMRFQFSAAEIRRIFDVPPDFVLSERTRLVFKDAPIPGTAMELIPVFSL